MFGGCIRLVEFGVVVEEVVEAEEEVVVGLPILGDLH